MSAASYVIPAPPPGFAIAVAGDSQDFPVRRIWCVGRNYIEHIREMGKTSVPPPFFFAKHADMLVPDGATIPYPPLTKDMHHEVELMVAMKSGGLQHPGRQGARSHLRLCRRHRPHPPRPPDRLAQEASGLGNRQVVRSAPRRARAI